MNSFAFTLNKIAGAVLGTCLVGMGIGIVAQGIYSPEAPKKPGFALPMPKEGGEGGAKEAGPSLPALLAKADPKRGEGAAKACGACHNFEEGAGNKVGPDLYGVVDRDKGSVSGFDYSAGLKKKGGKWTYADLFEFLKKPSAYVQGTKMGYAGEESAEKRADILVYLRSLSKNPAPLPKPTEGDKTAEGSKPETGKKDAGEKGGGDQFAQLVASSDPKKGEGAAQICGACHNFKKGAGAKIGPDLYGVVDREKGSEKGFDYSPGMKKKGGKWTYDDLNQFLTKPAAFVQGTKMGFAGEESEKKRAVIVAYLRTLADTPAPLPGSGSAEKKPEAGGDKKTEQKPAPQGDKKAEQSGEKKAEGGGGDQFAQLVATSDPKKGEGAAQICGACHNFKKGAGAKIGPDLYGVVDREKGSEKGFDYSPGMKKKGGKWTYDDLNQFLTKPAAFVQGTKMGFAGEESEKKRAVIVAYLRTLADTPAPLPGGGDKKTEQRAAPQGAKKAEQGAEKAEGGGENKPAPTPAGDKKPAEDKK